MLATARDESRPDIIDARLLSLAALGAFGVGGVITVVFKQVLAAQFAEPAARFAFVSRLDLYRAVPRPETGCRVCYCRTSTTHTLIHASFMVRMMVVPISLAAALLWPIRSRAAEARPEAIAPPDVSLVAADA